MGVNWDRPRTLDEMRKGYSHERARRRMMALLIASVCVVLVIGGVWLLLPTAPDIRPTGVISSPGSRPGAQPPDSVERRLSDRAGDLTQPPQAAPPQAALPAQPQMQRAVPLAPELAARDSTLLKPEASPQSAVPRAEIPPQEQQEQQQELLARVAIMIRQGDIAGARVILARLDRAGNRQATFTLAETYDPALLAQWNVRGIRPDPDKAAELYQRAVDGGISAARERLNALAATQR